jgi:hypothetical protein
MIAADPGRGRPGRPGSEEGPMAQPAGVYLPLSPPRRLIGDLLHFAARVPTVPVQRRMRLAVVAAARAAARPRPGWCALFTKALALTAAGYPPLRRAYVSLPWPRLYEHPTSVAMVAVERRLGDEDAVLFGPISAPDRLSLTELDGLLRRYKEAPLETVSSFRRALAWSRWPRALRRWAWWWGLNASGRKRAHYFGTFGVSSYGSLGAASLHTPALTTSTLTYGPVEDDGSVDVRLVYDHRVLDGGTTARALADLEGVLNHQILAELRYLQDLDAA